MKTTKVECRTGVWSVHQNGDRILITDPEGCVAHSSGDQESTAVHLAMQLADKWKGGAPANLIEAGKMMLEKFQDEPNDG